MKFLQSEHFGLNLPRYRQKKLAALQLAPFFSISVMTSSTYLSLNHSRIDVRWGCGCKWLIWEETPGFTKWEGEKTKISKKKVNKMSVKKWVSQCYGQLGSNPAVNTPRKSCRVFQNCPTGGQGDSIYPLTQLISDLRISPRRVYLSVLLG